MPGFAEFGMPIDIQINTVMNTLLEVITARYDS